MFDGTQLAQEHIPAGLEHWEERELPGDREHAFGMSADLA